MTFQKYLILAVAGVLYYNSQPSSSEELQILESNALTKPNLLGADVLKTSALWLKEHSNKKFSDFFVRN